MTSRSDEETYGTAIHEAGHAVIARALGLGCGRVTIRPNLRARTGGFAIIEDTWDTIEAWSRRGRYRDIATALRARILALMAGRAAEEELIGHCPGGDDDDQYRAACILMD